LTGNFTYNSRFWIYQFSMQIIRGLHNLRPKHRGCVATIGNFDGVHLGHQAVFRHLRERGAGLGLPSTVVTFEPQPMEFFAPQDAPARLTRMREKLMAIKDAGIDRVVLLEFGAKMAAMDAGDFVQELLVDGLGVRYLFVGDDFRFGRERSGDIEMLRQVGHQHAFIVENMNTFLLGEERVGSTRIREALSRGEMRVAEHNLGRAYRICGRVAHGDKRGQAIGFPTANINLHRRVSPLHGVYAVMVYGLGEPKPGVANVGNRPTVDGGERHLLEVHMFDFSGDIYGAHIEVEFSKKLRSEQRFESLKQLRQQIKLDVLEAREYFAIPNEEL
jgi:riboflavin kinase/FMN adenylyltransferase